ncbi:hypothetical protein ACQPXB_46150 [Amycolatopsis sp. CA-161197]|uniref:hypothetical protein n=1 Tax=Amycolatopsis sp. CA-161197 TaxID=3239922 RepID=UPI003D8E880D
MKKPSTIAATLAIAGAFLGAAALAAPGASALQGCSDHGGYRNCRTDANGGFVSVTAYPGIVKAAKSQPADVWIDSNQANHLAVGQGYTEYRPPNGGLRYRACAWFQNPITYNQGVVCTAWVQGY